MIRGTLGIAVQRSITLGKRCGRTPITRSCQSPHARARKPSARCPHALVHDYKYWQCAHAKSLRLRRPELRFCRALVYACAC
eukprot:2188798-Pleurochrysis_carterae.AAC.1